MWRGPCRFFVWWCLCWLVTKQANPVTMPGINFLCQELAPACHKTSKSGHHARNLAFRARNTPPPVTKQANPVTMPGKQLSVPGMSPRLSQNKRILSPCQETGLRCQERALACHRSSKSCHHARKLVFRARNQPWPVTKQANPVTMSGIWLSVPGISPSLSQIK